MKHSNDIPARKKPESKGLPKAQNKAYKPQKQQNRASNSPAAKDQKRLKGVISTTGKGTGFVAVEGVERKQKEDDILIFPENLNRALNGDEVEIVLNKPIPGERQDGTVVAILKRHKMEFVGVVKKQNGFSYVFPDDRKMYVDINLSKEEADKLHDGQKVLVKISSWEKNEGNPRGTVLKILGEKGEHEVEIQSIILERGISTDFPADVIKESEVLEKIEKPLPEAEIKKRRDMRDTWTSTIDPITAKDFDDAISYKDLPNGDMEIGVHIADVSYYVREGTRLDEEARNRAFSVYLVDRTIPMLPEVLSNDLCSLNPHEDKFSFSAVFIMDRKANIKERWFGRTVINSNKRFSYEDAQEVLNAKSGEHFNKLDTLNKIAKILREAKMKAGAIDFEQDEVRFELDPNGKPLRVYKKERLDTHKLVEEYMLLANREVAEFIYKSLAPVKGVGMYRIHDAPDKERLASLALFLKALGYELKMTNGETTAQDITAMLKQVEGKSEEALIKTATIRSMAKAIYSTHNIGHFGLAFKYYTHFTSPIRRYPDLLVHRILDHILTGHKKQAQDTFTVYERIALQSTEREIAAAEAERASIKYKQVEFMADKVGQTFEGTISGVTEWGIYVEEAETRAEGMIRLKDLGDDFYELDQKTYSIKGAKTGKRYSLGDKVKVKLMRADVDSKTLDFALA